MNEITSYLLGPEHGHYYAEIEGVCCANKYCDNQHVNIYRRCDDDLLLTLSPMPSRSLSALHRFAVVLAQKLSEDEELISALLDEEEENPDV